MPHTEAPPYVIGNLPLANLTSRQINGRACVFCEDMEGLGYAGWLRLPLSPGRHLSAPVMGCARCRLTREMPDDRGP